MCTEVESKKNQLVSREPEKIIRTHMKQMGRHATQDQVGSTLPSTLRSTLQTVAITTRT